jgi:hypothetical protein
MICSATVAYKSTLALLCPNSKCFACFRPSVVIAGIQYQSSLLRKPVMLGGVPMPRDVPICVTGTRFKQLQTGLI